MMRKLRTARTFSFHDWWILFQAWGLLLAVDLGLRVLPFRRIQGFVERGGGNSRPEAAVAETIRHYGRFVHIAARHHLYPMLCLRRSLVLQWLLGRQGIRTDLRFGVQKEMDDFSAHAWLEYEGQPVGEPQNIETRFLPLAAGKRISTVAERR
jgi:hypothetical protein